MKIRTWDKSGSKNEQNLRYYANIKKVIEVAAVEYVLNRIPDWVVDL